MPTPQQYADWQSARIVAQLWWCGDEECDCTQPMIERITPNRRAGYPWILRDTLWEGEFITDTWEYGREEREERQYAPLRAECERIGIAWPKDAAPSEQNDD